MSPREALLRVREAVETSGDGRVRHSYYPGFHRFPSLWIPPPYQMEYFKVGK